MRLYFLLKKAFSRAFNIRTCPLKHSKQTAHYILFFYFLTRTIHEIYDHNFVALVLGQVAKMYKVNLRYLYQ